MVNNISELNMATHKLIFDDIKSPFLYRLPFLEDIKIYCNPNNEIKHSGYVTHLWEPCQRKVLLKRWIVPEVLEVEGLLSSSELLG